LEVPENEAHSFAPVEGLVDVVIRLIETGIRNKTFHYSGLTKLTYFDFAKQFAKRFKYDSSLIVPGRNPLKKAGHHHTGELEDFSLNCTQLSEALKIKPLLLEQGFDLIEKKLIPRL
jgi:dTDP-4-dehydrorhamnose reductase